MKKLESTLVNAVFYLFNVKAVIMNTEHKLEYFVDNKLDGLIPLAMAELMYMYSKYDELGLKF